MAQEEVSMMLGVSAEITKLEDNMEGLKAFLKDAERRRITDMSVQRWSTKLNNAMYDATDILDLCQLEADKRRESKGGGTVEHKSPGCFQPLFFCLRNPMFAHKIGSRIKELNQRLESIHKEADMYKFNIGLGSNLEPRKLTAAELSSYRTSSHVDESAIVGDQIERDTRELVQVLTTNDDNNHSIKVVSIIGAGGMGKTTLAQKIFNDATIQEHFKSKIWLSITQQFDVVELLRTAIENADGYHGGKQDKSTLTETLINTISTGRFLLVMDDVWSHEAWNHVLSVPVRNASMKLLGSRVLVTTRSAQLPQQMQAPLHQHRVRPLENGDAWSLLKKQLQPDQVDGIDQLKTIGMEILQNCDGLPLAIKVIGGLLSTRYPSEHEWKSVLNKPAWSLTGLPPELDNRLYLSYEDLSPQIKQCFLYCSLFPKGKEIIGDVVTQMWISEGFIQPLDGSSIISHEYGFEEMATDYYRELIKRNLLQPTKGYLLTGYRCTMHDVVRSFAEYMAREESLVVVVGREHAATGMHVRRLSIEQTISVLDWGILQRRESLRTLIINSRVNFHLPGDSLSSFSSLRVLYIWSANSDTLVPSLSKLKHLRYLHLEHTDISRLPDDIHEMKFLLYIYLLGCKKLGHLPSKIIKLVHLRSLDTSSSNIGAVPKGFGGLTNLRLLYGFPVQMDMDASGSCWCSLQELAPLSQLRKLTLYGLEKVQDSRMAEKAMISSKRHLGYLELNYSASGHTIGTGGAEAQQQQQHKVIRWSPAKSKRVLEKLHPPTCIENLSVVGGYVGRQLPNWMCAPASADFKSLRYLTLKNLPCCTQLPDGLCCLPSLEVLTIIDAPAIKRIGPQFQASSSVAARGSDASTSAPFPKLRRLNMVGLREWEEWEWNDCEEHMDVETAIAMPCLERLKIENCKLTNQASRAPRGILIENYTFTSSPT
ncbi:putative disease resistance RPP13-like protein 1 [Miscanthus floridulus]|uniref:putative disease resistance RPP13-like protein 1 n=1 Tax=Miscanthus floridulus TaxID=154761 RepID=UPI00345AE691